MSGRDDSDEDVAFKSGILAHLAAHEPQHIVLTLAGLGLGEVAAAARGESDTVNTFLLAAAEAVNEYQAELAANRIVLSPLPHTAEALSEDLATFRASLAEAAGLVSTDYERVCSTVFTAAKELLKGVAYAAAYRFHAGDDRSEPDPRPEGGPISRRSVAGPHEHVRDDSTGRWRGRDDAARWHRLSDGRARDELA